MAPHSEIVLLTGADGFTGRHLATRLRAEGMRVFGATRHPSDAEDVKMDLSDGASVAAAVAEVSPDVVVHLAGIATALHANVAEIYAVNTVGTANLLSALAASPKLPRRVIIASSATVYAPPSDDTPITEDHPRRPAHHYGASKLAVEEIARLYSQKLPVIVTRPFNYTGVGQTGDFIVRKIIRHFQEGAAEIRLGELQLERDFSDRDSVRANVEMKTLSDRLRPVVVDANRGPEHFAELHRTLARLERTDGMQLSDLIMETQNRFSRQLSVLMLVQQVDDAMALALGLLRRRGFAVSAIVNQHDLDGLQDSAAKLMAYHVPVFALPNEESVPTVCRDALVNK
jgi:nucleoside-diphosphate-sugar epimerase